MPLDGISWVIVGGESGPGARPMKPEWVSSIREQCLAAGVPFFFKQWGGTRKKVTGRTLDGGTYDEFPVRVQNPIPAIDTRLRYVLEIENENLVQLKTA
jgi:protein gp37